MKRKSVLFVSPDYHCSFFHRDELRKLGWKADIYVENNYPEALLYSQEDIIRATKVNVGGHYLGRFIRAFLGGTAFLLAAWRYKYHLYYGGLGGTSVLDRRLYLNKFFGESFRLHLFLSKLIGIKIIFLPSGCSTQETKENFSKLDGGNVCGNCGWGEISCNDNYNKARFSVICRYIDMSIGDNCYDASQYKSTHFRYKSLDLNLWKPELEIPNEYRLPQTKNIRIFHSFFSKNRNVGGKNIKGSPFILDAVERLKKEGYPVEYMHIANVPSKYMRFYQVQADIIVEQLIYGWWGSTGAETMALGKPVVCYLRSSWKEFFFKLYPEYNELPIIEANTEDIYQVLKRLVEDHDYRIHMGKKSRGFAESFFDIKKNAIILSDLLQKIK